MNVIDVCVPYDPRPMQERLHHNLRRFNLIVAHRRFGKTVFCINETIQKALQCELPKPRYAYIAPFLAQAKDVAWEYLKYFTAPLPGVKVNESELRVDLPTGARIRLYGADNPDRLRGLYLDGAVLDEVAQMHPRVWPEIVRPALADRQGWAIFIGTPMGRNHFSELADYAANRADWYRARFKASETGILPQEELDAARATMSEDQYAQEFECSFDAAIQGAFYGTLINEAENEGRITKVPYDPKLPVNTAWDLGIDDATAIWFYQQLGLEIRIIDYYENSGEGLPHYAGVLNARGYVYGEHHLPHDVQVQELGTGQSRLETLASLGIRVKVGKRLSIEDGINASRNILPRCWFDLDKCGRGLLALKQYRKEFNDKLKTFSTRPLHDWTSHAADAFRYLATGIKDRDRTADTRPARAQQDYDPFAW